MAYKLHERPGHLRRARPRVSSDECLSEAIPPGGPAAKRLGSNSWGIAADDISLSTSNHFHGTAGICQLTRGTGRE